MKITKLRGKDKILITVLLFFHLIGVCSFFSPNLRPMVLPLSAFNLLLSFIVLILSYNDKHLKLLVFLSVCFASGMIFEWIGVHTGYLFGNYHYGQNLGNKLADVPLIIGINWGILVLISSSLASCLSKNIYLKTILASALMTFLDVLIEPVAISSNYWFWLNNEIPFFNYLCWFFLSLPLNFLFFKFKLKEQNKVAICLYFIFVVFFSILNFY